MREIKKGDEFILHSSNGLDYECQVINISDYRPEEMKYALDVTVNGESLPDVSFVGDQFFQLNEVIIEFKEEE